MSIFHLVLVGKGHDTSVPQLIQALREPVLPRSHICYRSLPAPKFDLAATTPEQQVTGKRKTDTDAPAAPANPNATDTTGASGTVDASQSKRKDTAEPPQSGAK